MHRQKKDAMVIGQHGAAFAGSGGCREHCSIAEHGSNAGEGQCNTLKRGGALRSFKQDIYSDVRFQGCIELGGGYVQISVHSHANVKAAGPNR